MFVLVEEIGGYYGKKENFYCRRKKGIVRKNL